MNTDNPTCAVTDLDVEAWKSCVGRQKLQYALVSSDILRRFALAAGIDANVERNTPALSHWALFVDAVTDEKLGPDGHPKRGDFLPNVFLSRRMFAAADLTFHAPLTLGAEAKMVSTIISVNHKSGRSGDLVFVKVQREISQDEKLCVTEVQTIVFRPEGDPVPPIPVVKQLKTDCEVWTPGPVQLFRFSAMTYNAHRIHYDLPYATTEEGYPGLVVHGPFTAIKLLDYACRKEGRPAHHYSFRGVAPLFTTQEILLSRGDESNQFEATRCDGAIAMVADVEFK